jgi:hypothetical protein
MKKWPLFVFLIATVLTSCKVTFNEELRELATKQKIDFSKIQFYNSEKIVLKRTLTSNEVSLASGKVTFENGEYTEIIKIKKHTKGRCDQVNANQMNISFEAGQNRSLPFVNNQSQRANSTYDLKPDNCKTIKKTSTTLKVNNRNQIQTKPIEWNVNECNITYENKLYKAEIPVMPSLLIKKRQIHKNSTSRRTAKGVKVS